LRAPIDVPLSLRAKGVSAFPEQEAVLVSHATATDHDLHQTPTVDLSPQADTTRWTLLVGSRQYVENERKRIAPRSVQLRGNYPNPVRRSTTIEYGLPESQHVRLAVYDLLGRRIQVLVDERRRAGVHTVRWNGTRQGGRVASGVYFYRLRTQDQTKTRKMVVVR
jgi:hypothetical protein